MKSSGIPVQIDKTAIVVNGLHDDEDEKKFWLAQSPQKRMEALELMRQIVYGYSPFTTRLQRILTITERT